MENPPQNDQPDPQEPLAGILDEFPFGEMARAYEQILTDVTDPDFSPLTTGMVLEFSDIADANQLLQHLRKFLYYELAETVCRRALGDTMADNILLAVTRNAELPEDDPHHATLRDRSNISLSWALATRFICTYLQGFYLTWSDEESDSGAGEEETENEEGDGAGDEAEFNWWVSNPESSDEYHWKNLLVFYDLGRYVDCYWERVSEAACELLQEMASWCSENRQREHPVLIVMACGVKLQVRQWFDSDRGKPRGTATIVGAVSTLLQGEGEWWAERFENPDEYP